MEDKGSRGGEMEMEGCLSSSPGHGPSFALEVVGRHAILFDDDATAAFINSQDALLPWNGDQSLVLDRYDVRHLLQHLSGLRRKRSAPPQPSNVTEAELDFERYRDLHHSHHPHPDNETSKRQKLTGDGYQNVPFSYDTEDTATGRRRSEEAMEISEFKPPFSVPENLLCHLPPTEKTHQIIARTAKFVSEHGGQSEIILRVKQGSNPVFGFLMPDHHLHVYFRYLVDHPEVLDSEKKTDTEDIVKSTVPGEGLSLLGLVYGTGDDEDEGTTNLSADTKEVDLSIQDHSVDTICFTADNCIALEQAESLVQRDMCSTEPNSASNHDASGMDMQSSILEGSRHKVSGDISGTQAPNSHNEIKNYLQPVQTLAGKLQDSALILEPPAFLKRVVHKMVEFIARNGKEFEGIIMNQDRSTGRFPFLLPSNQYHPYYLKVLEAAQKGKLHEIDARAEKSSSPTDARPNEVQKINQPKKKDNKVERASHIARGSTPEEMNTTQTTSTSDPEKKTKFKIVIGGIKKDGSDHVSGKPPGMTAEAAASAVGAATKRSGNFRVFSQGGAENKDSEKRESGMSADAAAAIVMAATRGSRKSQQGGTSESGSRKSQQGGTSESGTFHGGILEKILKGISEDSNGTGSAGVSSSHGDASNPHSSNGGMTLPHFEYRSGVSGSSSKLVVDAGLHCQQTGDVSGASGSILRLDESNMIKDDTSVAKVMVKVAALAASCEADSSEACLSREEKLKAERLKRAKMFAALIKSGHHGLEDKNVLSTPEGAVSLQNHSDGKATVCGSSYNGSSIQLDSPKGGTDEITKGEESGQTDVVAASKDHGNISTAKYSDRDRHSHSHHHHHRSDHKSSKSQHDKSVDKRDFRESSGRRHKNDSDRSHKDSISDRHSRRTHYESDSQRASEDRHRSHRHCSNSRDRDYGKRQDRYSSKDGHGHRSKDTSGQKHTNKSSGKEHSYKDENKEKVAMNLSNDTEFFAPEAPKSPTHATEVPDDLRAKVRAMLRATM